MDPLKRSPAKNTKSTETADTTTYQAGGELTNERSAVITGAGAYTPSRGSSRRGVVWYFDSCKQPEEERAGRRQLLPLHSEHVSP